MMKKSTKTVMNGMCDLIAQINVCIHVYDSWFVESIWDVIMWRVFMKNYGC